MNIYEKLFEAKKEIGKVTKDSTNPFFKSKYLSLNGLIDAVEPILEKHKLLLLQPIKDGNVYTTITDIEKPEDVVQSFIQLPNIQDPQKLGSAITYYRRYTLQSLLSTLAGDDDGNSATKQVKTERKEALTIEQFQGAKNGTKVQIENTLDKFRMGADQREILEGIKGRIK